MSKGALRRSTAGCLALLLAVHPLLVLPAEETPAPDVSPPEIVHAPLIEFASGVPYRIQATVKDNVGVAEVMLLYRSSGETEYHRMKMIRTAGTDMYSADLPDTVGPRVEYVIQASDVSGNRVLGQLFDPYVTTVPPRPAATDNLLAASSPATAAPARQSSSGESSGGGYSRWLWIGLGVVAVAVLAGAAGGSGGGGGGGGGGSAGTGGPSSGGTGGTGTGGTGSGTGTVTITAPVPASP